jgi:hypothetical protein
MYVSHLDDHASPLAVADVPPFRHQEWRIFALCEWRA